MLKDPKFLKCSKWKACRKSVPQLDQWILLLIYLNFLAVIHSLSCGIFDSHGVSLHFLISEIYQWISYASINRCYQEYQRLCFSLTNLFWQLWLIHWINCFILLGHRNEEKKLLKWAVFTKMQSEGESFWIISLN